MWRLAWLSFFPHLSQPILKLAMYCFRRAEVGGWCECAHACVPPCVRIFSWRYLRSREGRKPQNGGVGWMYLCCHWFRTLLCLSKVWGPVLFFSCFYYFKIFYWFIKSSQILTTNKKTKLQTKASLWQPPCCMNSKRFCSVASGTVKLHWETAGKTANKNCHKYPVF